MSFTTEACSPSPITDAVALAPAVLLMFKRVVFATGELDMPCEPALLDEHLQLIEDVLWAFDQKPPAAELQSWRQLIAAKLAEGAAMFPVPRLVFQYEPFDPLVGLTNGFQLRIVLRDVESMVTKVGSVQEQHAIELDARSRFEQRTIARGELEMPCVPSMVEHHMHYIEALLRALRQTLTPGELESWKQAIAPKISHWFQSSPNTNLVMRYELTDPLLGLQGGVKLNLSQRIQSIEACYQRWSNYREGPLFGSHPDAKVMAIAAQLENPADVPILDVGAGTGRNTLALARQGYPVDALELTYVLADKLWETAVAEDLTLTIIRANILDPQLDLKSAHYKLVILSEVIGSHFRSLEQVRYLMERMSGAIAPGGILLFNLFLAVDGYEPDTTVRELSQVYWSYVITRSELSTALAGLPLDILSDESVFDYERHHLPAIAFPPTSWFINWSTGRNLFPIEETPPMELRWIACQKIAEP